METMKQPAGTLRIGVVYPQTELRGDPGAVRRFGTAAEDLGFDHILAYDHVLGAVHAGRTPPLTGPYTEHDPFHDPLVMFGAALTASWLRPVPGARQAVPTSRWSRWASAWTPPTATSTTSPRRRARTARG